MVRAFQLCDGSSRGCEGRTSTAMPPETFPVATTISLLDRSAAGTASSASPGMAPAEIWSIAPLQVEGRLGGKSVADVAMQKLRTASGRSIRSEEHTSELQSLMRISYAVFCLKKKKTNTTTTKDKDIN